MKQINFVYIPKFRIKNNSIYMNNIFEQSDYSSKYIRISIALGIDYSYLGYINR